MKLFWIKYVPVLLLGIIFFLPVHRVEAAKILQPQNFLGTTVTCNLGSQVGRSCVLILTTVGSGSLTIPNEWHNGRITIEVLGGGGGAPTNAGGGGGGGYARKSNAILSGTVSYSVGAKGVALSNASSTWFCNSTSNCTTSSGSAVIVAASGGASDIAASGSGGGGGVFLAGDFGTSGGRGGNRTASGGGSGGGAGGPSGKGGAGTNGDPSGGGPQGGGGGANGGTSGVAGVAGVAGNGGDNRIGVGHGNAATAGADCTAGTNGGGGGGAFNATHAIGCAGSTDGIWTDGGQTVGPGGGGGAASNNQSGGNGGDYGGGAASNSTGTNNSVAGQGLIVLTYTPYTTSISHSSSASSTSSFANSLVAAWSFDGSQTNWATGQTFDGSGNGNTATLNLLSTSSSPTPGVIGQALKFDGATQYVNKSGAILSGVYTNWTVTAWIKTTEIAVANNGRAIYVERAASGNDILKLDSFANVACPNSVFATLRNDAGTLIQAACSSKVINDNKWHFVGMSLSGVPNSQTASIWVDGVLSSSASWTGGNTFTDANRQSRIAGDAGDNVSWTQGTLDDVRLYNKSLSATEMLELYHTGLANVAHSNIGSTTPQGSGLIGYWTFDGPMTNWSTGRTNDSSGEGNTGVMVTLSTTTSVVAGKVGQGLSFDGSASSVNVTASGSLNTSLVSVSAWIKPNRSLNGLDAGLVGKWAAGITDGWFIELGFTGDQPRFFTANTSASSWTPPSYVFPVNQWSHVVFVYDGVKDYFYVNGVLIGSNPNTGNISPTTKDVNIGQTHGSLGQNHFFPGALDEVKIYNRGLTADEVKRLYNAGR